MMLGDTVFYAGQNRLVDLTDVYNSIKGLGGGMWPSLLPSVQVGDKIYSIPMEADVTVLYARPRPLREGDWQARGPSNP
jgi:ABC-type glycerol-3-phosphate transport system substrate-binding protein